VHDKAESSMEKDVFRLAAGAFGLGFFAVGAALGGTGCSGDDSTSSMSPVDASDAGDAGAGDAGAGDAGDAAVVDAASTADASKDTAVDAGPLAYLDGAAQCDPDGGHGGHRWQDLYACYFGASGVAGCGTMTGCHNDPTDDAVITSGGFICDPSDAGACWQSMTSVLVPDGSASDPVDTTLYTSLRKPDGTGSMPLVPVNLVFQSGDMARISAWITSGAPNN
jgi:hypothetical protein